EAISGPGGQGAGRPVSRFGGGGPELLGACRLRPLYADASRKGSGRPSASPEGSPDAAARWVQVRALLL
ncbi:MAG: hypothetical protein AVDCRST_MAG28-3473, partial [uncultured Rubrobacteraceae bacterium]